MFKKFKKIFSKRLIFTLIIFSFLILIKITSAQDLSKRFSGYILLQVENNGEAYYINPSDNYRYFLARPENAFQIMREKGIGARNEDLEKIPIGNLNLNN